MGTQGRPHSPPLPTRCASVAARRGTSNGGHPLDASTRQHMEARFGHNFRQVRIHSDATAAAAADAVAARAYTLGHDIVFAADAFHPDLSDGHRLLVHEMAHVVQQQKVNPSARQPLALSRPDSPVEREAVASAEGRALRLSAVAEPMVCRQAAPDAEVWGAGALALGPIGQARVDVIAALAHTVERVQVAIHERDGAGIGIVPHDVDEALHQYFPGFGADFLDDILARIMMLIEWVPDISVWPVPRPVPAGFRDKPLLDQVPLGQPAQTMVRRALAAMDPGDDYVAVFPEWYQDQPHQATILLHEIFHFSFVGMGHAPPLNNAWTWQGFVSTVGGLPIR